MAQCKCGIDEKLNIKTLEYLHDIFKYPDFKSEVQKKVIKKVVNREHDVIVSLPNGYGRSLCYQLPAAMYSGSQATIIIYSHEFRTVSHVKKLQYLGIPCEIIDKQTLSIDNAKILNDIYIGAIRPCLIYVSLELVCSKRIELLFGFLREKHRLAYVVIDEIHTKQCWQDTSFTHLYKKLGVFRRLSQEIPWIVVASKIYSCAALALEKILKLKVNECGYGKFSVPAFRSNIYYECVIDDVLASSYHNLKEFLDLQLKDSKSTNQPSENNCSGLIFCKNQDKCLEIATQLRESGIRIAPFHGGLTDDEQHIIYNGFMHGYYKVLAVTSYTGRNIEKTDVRFIVHWGLPCSIMAYYNHTELAGKDGNFARCRIYATKKSLDYYNTARETELRQTAAQGNANDKLKYSLYVNTYVMKDFCSELQCKHGIFATYFGDATPKCIDKCDVCVSINKGSFVLKKSSGKSDKPGKKKNKMKALAKMMEDTKL